MGPSAGVEPRGVTGILFVLRTGTAWQLLPVKMGCGVWRRLHGVLFGKLAWADEIDWTRVAIDSSSVAAKRGARSARIQQIKPRQVANAILWSTPRASRSHSC